MRPEVGCLVYCNITSEKFSLETYIEIDLSLYVENCEFFLLKGHFPLTLLRKEQKGVDDPLSGGVVEIQVFILGALSNFLTRLHLQTKCISFSFLRF